jgi:hypothetical protein
LAFSHDLKSWHVPALTLVAVGAGENAHAPSEPPALHEILFL